MSFREKRALITLLALSVVVIGYAASQLRAGALAGLLPGLISASVLLIIILIASHVVLVIGAGAQEARQPSDERDRLVQLGSRRNAYWITAGGLWLVVMLAATGAPAGLIAQIALGAFVLGEVVLYASQLLYYRRGF